MNKAPELRFLFGLGNPGEHYRNTRHNVGSQFLEYLLEGSFTPTGKKQGGGLYTALFGELFQRPIYLVWPHTFMNDSGRGFSFFCQKQSFEPSEGLLVYDDLDIPLGQARIKPKGGAGGHRGLISIFAWMETERIPRLRVGVGQEGRLSEATPYLLSDFSREEEETIMRVFERCTQALRYLLTDDLNQAMTFLNRSPTSPPQDDEEGTE